MNVNKGISRLILVVSVVAMSAGAIVGYKYAQKELVPSTGEAFAKHYWDAKSAAKYYSFAKAYIKETDTAKNKPHAEFQRKTMLELLRKNYVHQKDLVGPYKVPPDFNRFVFEGAFPDELGVPKLQFVWSILAGALLLFVVPFMVLHLALFVCRWVGKGFKDS
jgi:hypothetical protein